MLDMNYDSFDFWSPRFYQKITSLTHHSPDRTYDKVADQGLDIIT